jgi:hypothetical protein
LLKLNPKMISISNLSLNSFPISLNSIWSEFGYDLGQYKWRQTNCLKLFESHSNNDLIFGKFSRIALKLSSFLYL